MYIRQSVIYGMTPPSSLGVGLVSCFKRNKFYKVASLIGWVKKKSKRSSERFDSCWPFMSSWLYVKYVLLQRWSQEAIRWKRGHTKKWINKNLKTFLHDYCWFFFKWRPLPFFFKFNKHNSQMNHGIFVDQFVQNPF